MSDDTTNSDSTTTSTDDTATTTDVDANGNIVPQTFTQADVDRIIAARLKRENLDGLRAAALELQTVKDAAKTDAEKVADRIQAVEAELTTAKAETLRWKIAAKHGISDADAQLFLTGTDEETLTAQAERLAERDTTPRTPRPDPSQGARQGTPPSTADLFAQAIQGQL